MRGLGRFLLALIFIPGLVVVLLAGAVRASVLSEKTWKESLGKGNFYEQASEKVGEFFESYLPEEKLEQLRREGTEEARRKLQIAEEMKGVEGKLKEGKMAEIMEMNIDRILGFLKSKDDDLNLYLPLSEVGLPEELLAEPPFDVLNGEASLREFIAKTSGEDKVESSMKGFKQMQKLVGIVNMVYVLGGLVLVLVLVGYAMLGRGVVGKVRGVSWLLVIGGLLGAGVTGLVGKIVKQMLTQGGAMSEVMLGLMETMTGAMMRSMKTTGWVVLGLGVVGVGGVTYMVKTGKWKVEKEELTEEERKKRRKKNLVVIGVVALLLGLLVFKVMNRVKTMRSQQPEVAELSLKAGVYESKYGWRIKPPASWGKREMEQFKTEMVLVPGKNPGDEGWTYVAVEQFGRRPEVDQGTFLQSFKELFLGEEMAKKAPGLVLVEEPKEGEWQGFKSYEYLFDHDYKEIRLRQIRRYLFPKEGGDGWLLYSQMRVDEWEKLRSIVTEVMESFEVK